MIERKIEYLPNVLQFTSFVFFSPSSISGPFFEYNDYINFIE